jgi:NAD(P)-dependent dehydrogenase (short-subunit alcohol dehydrogenase family)
MQLFHQDQWALILGGSSGFGLASAKKLSALGMSVCVVHRDRKGAMQRIDQQFDDIRRHGRPFISLNEDALSVEGQEKILALLADTLQDTGSIRVVLHSIALGNLKPVAPPAGQETAALIEDEDMARTVYSMGTSFLTWTQQLFQRRLFAPDARVLGLTSEGNTLAWRGYAAVSAAKVALEAVSRSIAVEFAPYGIRSNVIQAGVTDTPALRAIPGNEQMKATAILRNPFKRLTTPEDVAQVVALLAMDEAAWINGAIIRVDGGEHISSF